MKNHLQRYHVKNARHQDYRIGYPREILMIDLIGYPDFTPEVYTYDAKLMVQALLVDGHLLHLLFIPLPFLSILIHPPRDVLLRENFYILHLEIWSWVAVKY